MFETLIPKLIEYGVATGLLALIAFTLWKANQKLEKERRAREKDLVERIEDEGRRCRADNVDLVKRIRELERARLEDHKEAQRVMLRVLEANSQTMATSAKAVEKLAEIEAVVREGSGVYRRANPSDDTDTLEALDPRG